MKTRLVNDNFKKDYVGNLLRARGVADVNAYYEPSAEALQDPRDLENIDKAARLLKEVIEKNEKILIVVD